jgi:hypothetical protein
VQATELTKYIELPEQSALALRQAEFFAELKWQAEWELKK